MKYAFRSIIRYLNGDIETAIELATVAEKLHDNEQKAWYQVGEIIPVEVKRELYKMVG